MHTQQGVPLIHVTMGVTLFQNFNFQSYDENMFPFLVRIYF
mgnify:CR=1 FL=1